MAGWLPCEGWLVHALRAIQAADLGPRLAKEARWQALEVDRCHFAGPAWREDGGAAFEAISAQEEVLDAVRRAASLPGRPGIPVAKSWLRQQPGGSHLASRLSRLSKIRNGQAHPDVALVRDILAVALPEMQAELEGSTEDGRSDPEGGAMSASRTDCSYEKSSGETELQTTPPPVKCEPTPPQQKADWPQQQQQEQLQ